MEELLELKNISKHYPGVLALDHVNISFRGGEIHGLMGENGAGKSTLIKMIAGADTPDPGAEMYLEGKALPQGNPQLSKAEGIGVIYQEFNLVPSLSVAENIFLGTKTKNHSYTVDYDYINRESQETLKRLGLKIDSHTLVRTLSTAQQQMVEIAKACSRDCKVLIFDEPTASIAAAEAEELFKIIKELKATGVCIIYVSHRMDEIFKLCDRISVLRDGKYIGTRNAAEIDHAELIRMMIGRVLETDFPQRNVQIGETVLEVRNLTGNGDHNISFSLRKGEILGLGGLVGAGRTELAKMLCGDVRPVSGEILVHGEPKSFKTCADAVKCGIALIPEDRKHEGVFLNFNIIWNTNIMALKKFSYHLVVDEKKYRELYETYKNTLQIKTASEFQYARNLSGGNQQKVALAKVLAAENDILIFDEPTRGIDVGAKREIYKLMNSLVEKGVSIIMISSEMEELLGMSDRVIVLYEGMQMGELQKNEYSQENVMTLASGVRK